MCFKCFSFSGRGRVNSCSGEFGEILCGFCAFSCRRITILCGAFKHRQVRCKKKHHPYSRREKTSQVSKANDFTREWNERLHKQVGTVFLWRAAVAAWRCEVEPDGSVKWRLASSLFFLPEIRAKKWGASFCFRTSPLPERVKISFMQIKSTAKLLSTVLFAQNMCSWFNLYSMRQLLRYYDLFA